MSKHRIWDRWLQTVGWILVVFGLVFALFNQSSLFDLAFNQNIDPVFSGAAHVSEDMHRFQAWIYGVLGATIAGWGLFIVFLSQVSVSQTGKVGLEMRILGYFPLVRRRYHGICKVRCLFQRRLQLRLGFTGVRTATRHPREARVVYCRESGRDHFAHPRC